METSINSKDIVFAIVDEIGLDIDYVRHKRGAPGGRLYFTGIELAILVGTGTLASFFLGLAKGVLEEFGKESVKGIVGEIGKATGKAVGEVIVKRLKGIVSGILKSNPKDANEAQNQALSFQKELDDVIINDLNKLISRSELVEKLELTHEYEVHEVKTYLTKSGLTTEIASAHTEKVVKIIKTKFSSSK